MSSMAPLSTLDVIIPTHDRPPLLKQAVESALRGLTQAADIVDGRVIVVRNGSTDVELPAFEDPRVSIIQIPGYGASRARNAGVEASAAEFVGFLDDDDTWTGEHPRTHLKMLIGRPELALVFSQGILCDLNLTPQFRASPEGPFPDGDGFEFSLHHNVSINTVVARRTIVIEAGMFDESLVGSEDWDLQLKVAAKWPIAGILQVSTLLRQSPANSQSSASLSARFRDTMKVLKRARKLRSTPLSIRQRTTLTWPERGWYAYRFTVAAKEALERGDLADSRRSLGWAMRSSPVHATLRIPDFWRTAARTFVQWNSGQEIQDAGGEGCDRFRAR